VVTRSQVDEVSPAAAVELVKSGALLLDVREDHEWLSGHAPEAVHLPMSRFAEGANTLPTDRKIVCVCHLGGRSAMVAGALAGAGFQTVNLVGGIEAWQAAGLPVVTDDGQPGVI
jgi:rhodanese-related sulfurtransferase